MDSQFFMLHKRPRWGESMKGPKTAIYVVVAVVIGYLFTSIVPERLSINQEVSERLSINQDVPISSPAEGAFSKDIEEEADFKSQESPRPIIRETGDGFQAIGIWIVNLAIALGVYLFIKRRI